MDNYAHNHTSKQSIPKEILKFLPAGMKYFQNVEVVFQKIGMTQIQLSRQVIKYLTVHWILKLF